MNLEAFLDKVDAMIEGYQVEDLKLIIHRLALQCQYKDQDRFFNILQCNEQQSGVGLTKEEYASLSKRNIDANNFIDQINGRRESVSYSDVSDYDDGYEFAEIIFKFHINTDFFEKLKDICNLVYDYVKLSKYEEASVLGTKLLAANIFAKALDDSDDELPYDKSFSFHLSKINEDNTRGTYRIEIIKLVRQLSIDTILSTYFAYTGSVRVRKIFDLFRLSPKGLVLEDIIRGYGHELDDFQDFLKMNAKKTTYEHIS